MTAHARRTASPAPKTKEAEETKEGMSEEDRAKAMQKLTEKRLMIPLDGLKTISEHKYVPGVYTPLDNFMNKYFWTPLAEFLPRWIAPNTVTVSGLVLQILGFAVVSYHCPDFHASAPAWAYQLASFTIFSYQTLDAIDGKQARRTGSSSPLGQLFDHGCDSVSTIFIGMLTAMSLHLGFSVRCVTFIMCTLLPFWMSQWTEYHAHTLPTSIAGLIGVTEAQVFSVFIVLINSFDTGFWEQELGVWTAPAWWCGKESCPLTRNDTVVGMQMAAAVIGIGQCFRDVFTKAENKSLALLQTLPIYLLVFVGYAWCVMIPHAHPRLVLFSLGVSFSFITCKMIVAAMSQTKYQTFQSVLVPLPIIFIISLLRLLPRHDDVLLGAYTAISVLSMTRWIRNVIEEISQYIGIYTFRLGPRQKQH